jgi:tungstate transport system permease protein
MPWQDEMTSVLGLSLAISGMATAVAAAIAIPLGIFMGMREFKGKTIIVNLFNSFMGFPPVVMGVLVYLLLSKAGPLGFLRLVHTPTAIIIAQCLLCIPIITGITLSSITNHSKKIIETTLALGGSRSDVYENVFSENLVAILSGVMVGFGQNLSEVGASMIVGGNISGFTQTMTTFIVTYTGQGRAGDALLVGLVLIGTTFLIMLALTMLQMRARRS